MTSYIIIKIINRFTSLPTQKHPEGCSPGEVTHHHMDLTYTLTSMLTSCYDNSMIIVLSWILVYVIHLSQKVLIY